MWETQVWSLGWEDPLEDSMTIHHMILAWSIPMAEEPDGLQSIGMQRVVHDWVTKHSTAHSEVAIYTKTKYRVKNSGKKFRKTQSISFQEHLQRKDYVRLSHRRDRDIKT